MKKSLLASALVLLGLTGQAQEWTSEFWEAMAVDWGAESVGMGYLYPVNNKVVWATGYDGGDNDANYSKVARSTDGGMTWTVSEVVRSSTQLGIGNIFAFDENRAWVTVYNAVAAQNAQCGIYKTEDGGTTWTQIPNVMSGGASGFFSNNIHFFDEMHGFCHGDVSTANQWIAYTTSDGGANWTQIDLPSTGIEGEYGYVGCWDAAGSTGGFGSNEGLVMWTDDMGQTWRPVSVGTAGDVNAVAFMDDQTAIAMEFVAADNFTYYLTQDGGESWTVPFNTGDAPMFSAGVDFVPGTEIIVTTGAATDWTGASYSTNMQDFYQFGTPVPDDPDGTIHQYLDVKFYNQTIGFAGWFDAMWKWNAAMNDETAPTLASAMRSDELEEIHIYFSEDVDAVTATQIGNYMTNGNATVEAAEMIGFNGVRLMMADYDAASSYVITVNNVEDLNGNPIADDSQIALGVVSTANAELAGVRVFPNPTQDVLTIDNADRVSQVELFNLLGQRVASFNNTAAQTSIDMSQLQQGVYILNLRSANGALSTQRVVKN